MEDKYVSDRQFLEHILPSHYIIGETVPGAIWCGSQYGIGADEWDTIFTSIQKHFGDRFREVYHTTNHMHKRFCVYYKSFIPFWS